MKYFLTVVFVSVFFRLTVYAQNPITMDDAVRIALQKNEGIQAASIEIDYFRSIKRTSSDVGKLSATWMHGQYNSIYQDNNVTLTQSIPFPTVMTSQARLGKAQVSSALKNLAVVQNEIAFEVKSAYSQLLYLRALGELLRAQDSLFEDFVRASSSRFKAGEGTLLEKTTAEVQLQESRNQMRQNESDRKMIEVQLQSLLKSDGPVQAAEKLQRRARVDDSSSIGLNPKLTFLRQEAVTVTQAARVEKNKLLPDITFGFFTQSLTGVQNINGQDQFFGRNRQFRGFELGIAVPVWIAPQLARVRAADYRAASQQKSADYYATTLKRSFTQASEESLKYESSLDYYESSALVNARLILSQAQKSWRAGEIAYVEYLQSLRTSQGIQAGYLSAINQYNQSLIRIEFLLGSL